MGAASRLLGHAGALFGIKGAQERMDQALFEACSAGSELDALALMRRGARPSVLGPLGSTCLMFAARRDCAKLFMALCSHPSTDAKARDCRGRDALAWAGTRASLKEAMAWERPGRPGVRRIAPPLSNLFRELDDSLFDLGNLDDDGRHALQSALDSRDEDACLFWFARAPGAQVEKAFEKMDAFAKHNGLLEQAQEWLSRAQAEKLRSEIGQALDAGSQKARSGRL